MKTYSAGGGVGLFRVGMKDQVGCFGSTIEKGVACEGHLKDLGDNVY